MYGGVVRNDDVVLDVLFRRAEAELDDARLRMLKIVGRIATTSSRFLSEDSVLHHMCRR